MDFAKPVRLPKNYYSTLYFKDSKAAFMNEINSKCQDKEDITACLEKYSKAYDSVFEHLKTKKEEEDRVTYIFDKRNRNAEGLTPLYLRKNFTTGYEKV
jgi:hypothetical protein